MQEVSQCFLPYRAVGDSHNYVLFFQGQNLIRLSRKFFTVRNNYHTLVFFVGHPLQKFDNPPGCFFIEVSRRLIDRRLTS